MKKTLYIYGAGGHAKVVAATAVLCGWEIGGFFADGVPNAGEKFFGSPMLSFAEIPRGAAMFIAFGNNKIRLIRGMELKSDFVFPTIIHPSARIADSAEIGTGTYIGAMVNIDPDCRIGDFCIINKLANISHDSSVGDGTHCSIGSLLAGNVTVGKTCCIGMGSRIIEKRHVGDNTIIGAGAVVIRDTPGCVTAVGVPAKIIKTHRD